VRSTDHEAVTLEDFCSLIWWLGALWKTEVLQKYERISEEQTERESQGRSERFFIPQGAVHRYVRLPRNNSAMEVRALEW
jgi:hypothetical protein